jgi:signal transduction histidine kinase
MYSLILTIQNNSSVDSVSLMITFLIFIAFIVGWVVNRISILRIRKNSEQVKDLSAIMQHTLNASDNYVIKLSMQDRIGFNMHGDFLPEEGMGYEESLDYIHPDDRHLYTEALRRLIKGAKTTECLFRWDWSTKEHKGEWHWMRDIGIAEYANPALKIPTNFFCTLTDETERILREQQELEMTDRYRKIFNQSLVGLAFYDKEGKLLAANKKMRDILKFQGEKDPYYFNSTIYNMPTFREMLYDRKAQELYFCTKSVIIERGVNCYTEMRVHPVYDEKGELFYITFSIRDITQERELYLENKRNEARIRQQSQAIQRYENELQYLMDNCDMRFFRININERICTFYKGMSIPELRLNFDELIDHFVDSPFKQGLKEYETYFSVQRTELTHMRPFFHESEELQWNFIESVPFFDENGKMMGTYGVVRNVTNLIEKQERLKEETERANQSGLRKSTFMANMTHEIRTPLNAIVGFSDVLPMMTTTEEKQEIIRVIMNNCDMLLRLVNDILAVSSLETAGIEITPRQVDFAKVFTDVSTILAQRVQNPEVQFITDNPYDSFVTTIDSGRMQQVVTNFVTNAVKYTHQGHIKIGYEYQQRGGRNGLYMYCEDTGTGIPKEDQAKVFDRFVKLNDYVQGTGLGLSICKAIADSCKGEIGLTSEGEGTGSTFWIWIPCEKSEL